MSGHNSRGSWPDSVSSWSIFTTEEVSLSQLETRRWLARGERGAGEYVHGTPELTRAGGGSRFIGTRAAQLVVGVERKRERERERGYWVLKTGYGGKYKYLNVPHMTTMTLDIKTQYRLFTFVYCSASFYWIILYAQSGLYSNIFDAFNVLLHPLQSWCWYRYMGIQKCYERCSIFAPCSDDSFHMVRVREAVLVRSR